MTKRSIQEKYREKMNRKKEERKSIASVVSLTIVALLIIVVIVMFDQDMHFFDNPITVIRKIG